jgi:hypothetical protein
MLSAGKRGPLTAAAEQIEWLNQLPKAQQKIVMRIIDTVLAQQDC